MPHSEPPSEETELHRVALTPQFRSVPRVRWTDSAGAHEQSIDGRMTVGSANGSSIHVQDATVSRLHAELEVRNDGLWVRDLGSRNGTFVDGLQVTGAKVIEGSKIELGAVELLVSSGDRKPVELWTKASFGGLLGESVAMRELFAVLARVAPMEGSVLVHGETGTGKELVARAIHDASPRKDGPFVVVDCAALPENLLDAELFGHARGAFTGAVQPREGSIEAANGGTVFLDEIGELPMSMQPKLLRVLESRVVRRIGETGYREVDVRFISATHRDLLAMASSGEFREDLYFRLSVLPVNVPPLRAHPEDIEALVNHFLRRIGAKQKASPQLVRELASRPWRGNVRELRNFVERAQSLGVNEALRMMAGTTSHAPPELERSAPSSPLAPASVPGDAVVTDTSTNLADDAMFDKTYRQFREDWVDAGEKEYVRRLLARHERNVAAAAKDAGIDRTYIYRLVRKHAL